MDRRTPNLFVIGAPKAGTTFLHHALGRAAPVYMSRVKEPGFFSSDRDYRLGLGYYLDAYFPDAAGHALRGESTPWYLYSLPALERIGAVSFAENPRFVVTIRRPSSRAFSMYRDQVRKGRESRPFEQAVDEELCALERGELQPDVRQRYVWCGRYSEHVERWRAQFGPDQVRVVVFEDFAASPETVWDGLARFLGEDLGPSQFESVSLSERNPGGRLRWPRVDRMIQRFEGRDSRVVDAAKRALPPGWHRRVLQDFGRRNRVPEPDAWPDPDAGLQRRIDTFCQEDTERLERLLGLRLVDRWSDEDGRRRAVEADRHRNDPAERTAQPSSAAEIGQTEAREHEQVRVLHVVGQSHRRGAELFAVELAEELEALGYQNRLVAVGVGHDGGREASLESLVHSAHMGPGALVMAAWRMRRLLADDPVDVVLAHGGWQMQVAAFAAPRRGPLIVWQRILGFPDMLWHNPRRWWWSRLVRRVDAGVALTVELATELRRLGFKGPVWVIPNARRPDRFLNIDREIEAKWLRNELGLAPEVLLLGFVGHLVDQKRPERAVEVLARLRERGRDVHLVVAGGGPLAESLASEIGTRGLDEHVSLLGQRHDVERIYGGIDLLLLTSDDEGIPGVAIEAQMAGCPVVTFALGGVGQVVEDGVSGVVLPGRDPRQMAEQADRLLDDPDRRARMSERGRERAHVFTTGRTAATYADHFADLLGRAPSRSG